jgi:hypothetical protein
MLFASRPICCLDGYHGSFFSLCSAPVSYLPGFHRASNLHDKTQLDVDLYLVHLHRVDYEHTKLRHLARYIPTRHLWPLSHASLALITRFVGTQHTLRWHSSHASLAWAHRKKQKWKQSDVEVRNKLDRYRCST